MRRPDQHAGQHAVLPLPGAGGGGGGGLPLQHEPRVLPRGHPLLLCAPGGHAGIVHPPPPPPSPLARFNLPLFGWLARGTSQAHSCCSMAGYAPLLCAPGGACRFSPPPPPTSCSRLLPSSTGCVCEFRPHTQYWRMGEPAICTCLRASPGGTACCTVTRIHLSVEGVVQVVVRQFAAAVQLLWHELELHQQQERNRGADVAPAGMSAGLNAVRAAAEGPGSL